MIGVQVQGIPGIIGRLEQLKKDLTVNVEREMTAASRELHRELGHRMTHPASSDAFFGRRGADPPYLGRRTGQLVRSLSPGDVYQIGNELRFSIGSALSYAQMLEEGGTVHGNPMLRIPLAAAQKASGEDKHAGESVRGLKEFFVVRSHGGRPFLVRSGGPRGVLEFWYILVRSVTIRPHRVFATAAEWFRPIVEGRIGRQVAVDVRRANG